MENIKVLDKYDVLRVMNSLNSNDADGPRNFAERILFFNAFRPMNLEPDIRALARWGL